MEKIVSTAIKGLGWLANLTISALALIIVANVVGRYFFHKGILGTVELVELFAVVFACLSMAYCTSTRGDVQVDLVTSRLSRHIKSILFSIGFFLSAFLCLFIIYQCTILAISFARDPNQVSTLLNIPLFPFRFMLPFGFLLVFLAMFLLGLRPLPTEEEHKES